MNGAGTNCGVSTPQYLVVPFDIPKTELVGIQSCASAALDAYCQLLREALGLPHMRAREGQQLAVALLQARSLPRLRRLRLARPMLIRPVHSLTTSAGKPVDCCATTRVSSRFIAAADCSPDFLEARACTAGRPAPTSGDGWWRRHAPHLA